MTGDKLSLKAINMETGKICPLPPKEGYRDDAKLVANALAESIVRGLNLKELIYVYILASEYPNSLGFRKICRSLKPLFSIESIIPGLKVGIVGNLANNIAEGLNSKELANIYNLVSKVPRT